MMESWQGPHQGSCQNHPDEVSKNFDRVDLEAPDGPKRYGKAMKRLPERRLKPTAAFLPVIPSPRRPPFIDKCFVFCHRQRNPHFDRGYPAPGPSTGSATRGAAAKSNFCIEATAAGAPLSKGFTALQG